MSKLYGKTYDGEVNGVRYEVMHYGAEVMFGVQYSGGFTWMWTDTAYPDGRMLMVEGPGHYRTLVPFAGVLARLGGVTSAELRGAMESRPELRQLRDSFKQAVADRDAFLERWPGNLTPEDRKEIQRKKDEPAMRGLEHPQDFLTRMASEESDNPWVKLACDRVRQLEQQRLAR